MTKTLFDAAPDVRSIRYRLADLETWVLRNLSGDGAGTDE